MKKLLLAVVSAGFIVLLLNCASDIVLPEPPEIAGNYDGWFVFRDVGATVPDTQAIAWVFDDPDEERPGFIMNVNLDSPDLDSTFCLCEVFGLYVVTDRVELRTDENKATPPEAICNTCNRAQIPDGLFRLVRVADTLKLTQSGDQYIQIVLWPVVEDGP